MNFRYEIARLGTDFYLQGVQDKYRAGKTIPPPRYVIWDCTRRCNLHCIHCGATKEQYPQELDTKLMKKILRELAYLHVDMFALTGGEPMLREDLFELLAHAHNLGLKTGLATNGFFIDRMVSSQLQDCGVHSIQISLDGSEKIHNAIRGDKQSYTRAIDAINNLFDRKIPVVTVATTVTTKNIDDLDDLGSVLTRFGVRQWRLSLVMPIGRAQSRSLILSHDQLRKLLSFIREHNQKNFRIVMGENLPFLADHETLIRNEPLICPIGFTSCCIGVNGYIRGCPEQPDVQENQEGSILKDSFSHIWNTGFRRYRLREILKNDLSCNSCRDKNSCYGGCWVMRTANQHCIHQLLSPS